MAEVTGISVLHVDDDPAFADLTADMLAEEAGEFTVETATSASEGLDLLATTDFDCIVSDFAMPGQNGIEFLETLREENPDLPFILYTGQGSEEVASDAIAAGATDYLQKESGTDQYKLLANRIQNAVEQSRAQQRAAELERIRVLVNDINQALVRANSRSAVETQVCEIISESDPYLFAWIGEVDAETDRVEPRAWAGVEDGYLDDFTATADETATACGPTGTAIRERQIAVSQNLHENGEYEPGRESARDRRYQSSATVPLEYNDTLYGVLNVYAGRPDAFDDDEQEVLTELAGDIGHAIHAVEVKDSLERAQQRAEQYFETAGNVMVVLNTDGTVARINERGCDLLGYEHSELVGSDWFDLVVPGTIEREITDIFSAFWSEDAKPIQTNVNSIETKDGKQIVVEWHNTAIQDQEGNVTGVLSSGIDITERKERERALEESARRYRSLFEAHPEVVWVEDFSAVRDHIEALRAKVDDVQAYLEANPEEAQTVLEQVEILDVSEQALDRYGAPSKEALLENTGELFTPEAYEANAEIWRRLVEGETHFRVQTVAETFDGDRYDEIIDVRVPDTHTDDYSRVYLTAIDITERKEREEKYRNLFEENRDALMVFDRDGYLDCNEQTLDLFGIGSVDDFLDYSPWELSPPKQPDGRNSEEAAREHVETAFQEGEEFFKWTHQRVDGTEFPSEVKLSRFSYGGETVILGLIRDITERKERERELAAAQEVSQKIIEASPVPIWVQDVEEILYSNDAAAAFFGYEDPESLVGTSAFAHVPEDERDRARNRNETMLETGEAIDELPGQVVAKDGTTRDAVLAAAPITYHGGQAIVTIANDITERKEKKQEIKELKNRLELAVEGAELGVWDRDMRTDHEEFNEEWAAMLGHSLDEIEQHKQAWEKRLHPDDIDAAKAEFDDYIAGNTPIYDTEYRMKTADGDWKWIHDIGKVVERDENGQPLRAVGVHQDITGRKEREEELQRQNSRLNEFASVVSHDLRNPLTVAVGRAELLQEQCDGKSRDHVDTIVTVLERMESIIENTLTLAQQGDTVGKMTPIQITCLVEQCWDGVETTGATLDIADGFTVRGDRERLRHVFENLFRNAVEHAGDDVTVRVGRAGEDRFYVEDDGTGIPADDCETVFDAGHSSATEGTGFGLTIVKRIAEAHGWGVSVTDGRDGGARFEFDSVEMNNE